MAAISGFLSTWGASYASTKNGMTVRNIEQGENRVLSTLPKGLQAGWASSVASQVASLAPGPIGTVANCFKYVFNPFVSVPIAITASLNETNLYEKSFSAEGKGTTLYFPSEQEAYGFGSTVPIEVGGKIRYFKLGSSHGINSVMPVNKNGKKELWWYRRLEAYDVRGKDDVQITLRGEKVWVRPGSKVDFNYVTIWRNGQESFYEIAKEVKEPIGRSQTAPREDAAKVVVEPQTFYFDTEGESRSLPKGGECFVVNGKKKYFKKATYRKSAFMGVSGGLNAALKSKGLPAIFPERLRIISRKAWGIISRHMSQVVRLVIIAAGAAFVYLGQTYMALGALLPVVYEYLDHDLGLIPMKVSYFMEEWMPMISKAGLLITGSLGYQIMAGISLLSEIPSIALWMHHKLGPIIRSTAFAVVKLKMSPKQVEKAEAGLEHLPHLKEIDQPFKGESFFNFGQIQSILRAKEKDFRFHAPHFSADYTPALKLPENHQFQKLLELWDEDKAFWDSEKGAELLYKKSMDEELFIAFLRKTSSSAKRLFTQSNPHNNPRITEENKARKAEYEIKFKGWIETAARARKQTVAQLLSSWYREQLVYYVNKVSGKKAIEGGQKYLLDAVEYTAKILPFLLEYDRLSKKGEDSEECRLNLMAKQDLLAKIAIEGGNTCSLGMRRASSEILEDKLEPLRKLKGEGSDNPKVLIPELLWRLQKERVRILANISRSIALGLGHTEAFSSTAGDVHLHVALKEFLDRGFLPQSKYDRDHFSFLQLIFQETLFLPGKGELLYKYKTAVESELRRIEKLNGNDRANRILIFLRSWTERNENLTTAQKETLLNGILAETDDNLMDPDVHKQWHLLFLNIAGVIEKIPAG